MNITKFFNKTNLEDTFILGYYGAGNFGDELLLEIILGILKNKKYKNIKFFYSSPKKYKKTHQNYKFKLINGSKKKEVLYNIFKSKNIIIGGGGLWGKDFSKNLLFLTIILLFAKILRKNIYCIGVGYYDTAPFLGKISALIIANASKELIVRDPESFLNFKRFTKKVALDKDLAFFYELTNYEYKAEIEKVDNSTKKVIIGLRRFKNRKIEKLWKKIIKEIVEKNKKTKFILTIFEFKEMDQIGYKFIKDLERENKNVTAMEFNYNPLEMIYFLKKNAKNIKVICPQFHLSIASIITGTKFFPISYENKSKKLFEEYNIKYFEIDKITSKQVTKFLMEEKV